MAQLWQIRSGFSHYYYQTLIPNPYPSLIPNPKLILSLTSRYRFYGGSYSLLKPPFLPRATESGTPAAAAALMTSSKAWRDGAAAAAAALEGGKIPGKSEAAAAAAAEAEEPPPARLELPLSDEVFRSKCLNVQERRIRKGQPRRIGRMERTDGQTR